MATKMVKMKMDYGRDPESIFDNSLVMSNILSFLCLEDVLNARLVSKSWSQHAIPPMRKLTLVKIYCKSIPWLDSYIEATQRVDGPFEHYNFAICHDMDYPTASGENNLKILKFFQTIESNRPGRIRFFRAILGKTDLDFLARILMCLNKVERLEIVLSPQAKVSESLGIFETFPVSKGNLKCVKEIAFIFANIRRKEAAAMLGPLFGAVFPKNGEPSGVGKVEIFDRSKKSVIGGTVLHKMNQWRLARLGSIRLTYAGSSIIRQIQLISAQLYELKFGIVSWLDLPLVRELMVRNGGTLRILEVEVSTGSCLTRNSRCTGKSDFVMPVMPNLTKFTYAVGKLPLNVMIGSGWCGTGMLKHYNSLATMESLSFLDYMNFIQILSGGKSAFAKTFPRLVNLELKLCGGYNRFHDIFFSAVPEDVQIPQIQEFLLELPNWGTPKECSQLVERTSKIFPTVKHPRFEGMDEDED